MYIKPLSAIIDSHSIIHHSYADDLQLQMSAPPDRISELLHSMQSCISDVKAWATANMLKLNDSKIELMLVTSKRSKHLHNLPTSITIGNAQIPFKQSVKNLGFTLDCHLTMNAHVSNIARTCYYELRRLASIRRFLTSTATATLVSAFVLSRIDYCNSLLFGSTNDVTSHLQRIQNYAARVIFRLPMSSSITIHLKSLHWLPVNLPIYFTNKVEKLRANIASEHVTSTLVTGTTAATFSSFEKVSQLTVKECILSSAPKSCELDPIPSKLLIECLDSILPSLTDLFNSSLASGIFPQCFKSALVTPILKKRCLDHNDLNNYRPVSNLCFIAKILEKLVLSQVSSYLNSHNLYNTCQSAYRPGHSTETALLKVVNDLFLSLNKGNISVLALLDFSSAFDTIDHTILVHRLHTDFGFTDTVLQWFSSYLTDRTHYVSLCNHCSDFAPVHSGVPQGSVLGPILFTMYIKPLSAIIDSHSIIHHSFADDLQLQMSAPPDRISELLHSMQSCISDVKAWATVNMLRLNDSKTELMLVTSKRSKHLHNLPTSITIGNAQIPFKQSVKNLGFTLDCHLTMNAHVSNIARTCYFELRRLAYIRRFLTSTATATLVSAFVLSRIDYCNSLLFGSTLDVTSHLQRIQNYAARVILRLPMSSRITIHLKSLHWLPVKVRSTYKIACLCYHCHSSTAPSYVTDMLHKKPLHTRNTRSSSYTMPLLNRPAHSKATLGDRSFSFASSSVWNSIPNDVKCAPSLSSFKSRLKTYLFRSVYKD